MHRRDVLAGAGVAFSAALAGCDSTTTAEEGGPPGRPWEASDPTDDPDATHDLVVENHTDATRPVWLRVVGDDGTTPVDGRYELPDGRGIEFAAVAAWETTYVVDLAIDGEDVQTLEWVTEDCGADSEVSGDGGSRSATVGVEAPTDDEAHRASIHVDECDASVGPTLPTGPAEGFRLDG